MLIKFDTKLVEDTEETLNQGKVVMKEIEWIEIIVDERNKIDRPAKPQDKIKYKEIYTAWVEGREPPLEGSPLSEWPMLSKTEVDRLNRSGLRSVEDLAQASDTLLERCGPTFRTKREAARKFLESDDSIRTKLQVVEKENETLKTKLDEQSEQITHLTQRLAALEGASIPTDVPDNHVVDT